MTFNQTDYGNCRVTAVILARNEEQTIREVVQGAAHFVHEVVLMDGRSTDRTAAVAREAGAIVHIDNGKGKGAATRQSLELVDADVIVFMDADGSHDPADIPRLALPIVRDQTDLCVGSRFAGGSDELSIGFAQLIRSNGNILMNIAINKRWNVSLSDTLNGFRAIRRRAALSLGLKENRHTIEQEMVMKMLRYGYRVMNVPTHEYERKYGRSHINIWKEWPMFVWCVITNIARKDSSKHFAGAIPRSNQATRNP
jgi:glycosyltransferase involved in cell wall biosynthesis